MVDVENFTLPPLLAKIYPPPSRGGVPHNYDGEKCVGGVGGERVVLFCLEELEILRK